ncbi:ATP-binding protein [Caenimonas sp. SL110]|uniref:AAA family ATPase n=1 Tax=Caenimonas sp. SL110 TaxID=1450524 RepID=UPI00137922F0|nr:ATP-binding protein [Caenimonas sp. SL110]
MTRRHPTRHSHRHQWTPESKDIVSIANNRVCLSLLRIYRYIPYSADEVDLHELLTPFWPLIRRQPKLLRQALMEHARRSAPRSTQKLEAPEANLLPPWVTSRATAKNPIPEDTPDLDVMTLLAEGLVFARPIFRPLFNAVEEQLQGFVETQHAPSDANVSLLTDLLGLSNTERAMLALSSAIETSTIGSSPFARFTRPSRQVQALSAALEVPCDREARACLGSQNNLRRSGLLGRLALSERDLEEALRLTRQGSTLLGSRVHRMEDMAALILKPLSQQRCSIPLAWPHLEERSQLLTALLTNTLKTGASGVNILLYGAPGTGKTAYAADLIARAGAQGFSVTDTDADDAAASRNERLANMALTQTFAPAQRSIVVLDEAEDIFEADYNSPLARVFGKKEGSKAWMNGLLEGNLNPVIWISNQIDHIDPAYLRRFTYCMQFPTTPRGVRQAIAHAHLDPIGCSPDLVSSIASHEHVSPAILATSARFATLAGVTGPAIDTAVRHMLTDNLLALGKDIAASVPVRATRFDLRYINVKEKLDPEAILGGLQRLGRGTLLLSGPPGTGKTQLAAEIAQRLGRELVYKTAADINTMWFGESERNVARMFTECDAQREVLFLDEADTLLSERDAANHRGDLAVTAEFLRRVEAFDGVFVCATNHARRLDPALMRRFTFRLGFLPLSEQQRLEMLYETALGWQPTSDGAAPRPSHEVLRRMNRLDQLTPGDFANVVKRVRALELTLDIDEWVTELESEHDVKPEGSRAAMGFI